MTKLLPALAVAGLLMAGCGPKEIALPADPIDKAATCGVVAAANARAGTKDLKAELTLDQQGQILHYALLAGEDGETFSQDRVTKVVERMPALEGDITSGKWQPLVAQCAAAFPQTGVTAVTLPADPLEAQTGCYVLGQFMAKALAAQANLYTDKLSEYGAMNRKLDARIGSGFRRQGVAQGEEAQAARKDALGEAAKLGPPARVMQACLDKYA